MSDIAGPFARGSTMSNIAGPFEDVPINPKSIADAAKEAARRVKKPTPKSKSSLAPILVLVLLYLATRS